MSVSVHEPFVEGWDFVQTLGEGAYGEVRLAINRETQEAVAVKIVNNEKLGTNGDDLRKEVCIHKMLHDQHIIKFFGQRTEQDRIFLFLEYASGGELFDRIEPDVGMPLAQAHKYFKELIHGMEYLHSVGVTHRDIKPENLLLDVEGNLKITDFGLSTVFKYKSKERMLDRVCGTAPYVAPEVLSQKEYKAEPADIWSCGIVLTAMIAGELPWDEPSEKCREYVQWVQNKVLNTPWTKIDTISFGFLIRLLHPIPVKRYTIPQLKKDKWFLKSYSTLKSKSPRSGASHGDSQPIKRHCSINNSSPLTPKCHSTRLSSSQPQPYTRYGSDEEGEVEGKDEPLASVCFSQPLHIEDMLLSQISSTPVSSQNTFAHLVKRMTRFNVTLSLEEGIKSLSKVLETLTLQYKIISQNQVRITTVDRRKSMLTYLVNFVCITQLPLLLDFRLSKGDGIEFKRQFKKIKTLMRDYIV